MVFQASKHQKDGQPSRTIRQVVEYATNNGERPLKKRGIEAFASSNGAAAQQHGGGQLDASVLAAVKAVGGPSKVARTATKVALQLSTMGTTLTVRRVAVPSSDDAAANAVTTVAADAIALGSLQRHVACTAAAETDHSLLVVVDTPQTAHAIAVRLETLYKMQVLQLTDDAVKFPTWPTAPSASAAVDCTTTVVVVATTAGLVATNKRSAIWKFCGAMVVLSTASLMAQLRNGGSDDAAIREARLNIPARVCVVLGASLADVSAPILASLTTPSLEAAGAVATNQGASQATPAPTSVAYMVVDGLMKFQVLCGLLASQAASSCPPSMPTQGVANQRTSPQRALSVVTVHFNNPETAAFWCDVLLALNELPKGTTIVCDSEDPREARRMGPEACCTEAIRRVDAAVDAANGAVILLSSFGAVPTPRAATTANDGVLHLRYVLVQYDPLVNITGFNRFLGAHVVATPGASASTGASSAAAAVMATPARSTSARGATARSNKNGPPPPTPRAVMLSPTPAELGSQLSTTAVPSTPTASSRPYDTVLLLLHTNEAEAAITVLQGSVDAATCHVQYLATPLPSATTGYLSAQRMKGLHKRVFTIQNRAYEAYRTSMHVYSRLHPSSVYQVRDLNLDAYAAELGYEEAPLLDLRTKATPYRPAEDLKKASMKRLVEERRAKRKYADAELVGTGPEEHVVPSDNEGEA